MYSDLNVFLLAPLPRLFYHQFLMDLNHFPYLYVEWLGICHTDNSFDMDQYNICWYLVFILFLELSSVYFCYIMFILLLLNLIIPGK